MELRSDNSVFPDNLHSIGTYKVHFVYFFIRFLLTLVNRTSLKSFCVPVKDLNILPLKMVKWSNIFESGLKSL